VNLWIAKAPPTYSPTTLVDDSVTSVFIFLFTFISPLAQRTHSCPQWVYSTVMGGWTGGTHSGAPLNIAYPWGYTLMNTVVTVDMRWTRVCTKECALIQRKRYSVPIKSTNRNDEDDIIVRIKVLWKAYSCTRWHEKTDIMSPRQSLIHARL